MKEKQTKSGDWNFRNDFGIVVVTWYPKAKVARHAYEIVKCPTLELAKRIADTYANDEKEWMGDRVYYA
tara:strand:- start:20153 stop:20359 length:207 start_codon:yes stop_codon:yes gene_type:complete